MFSGFTVGGGQVPETASRNSMVGSTARVCELIHELRGGGAPEGPLSIPPVIPPTPLESDVPVPLVWATIGTQIPPIPPGFGAFSPQILPEIGTRIPLLMYFLHRFGWGLELLIQLLS